MTTQPRPGIVERSACPVCGGTRCDALLELPYDQDPLRPYLADFYGGRFRQEWVDDLAFRLDECADCGLVFQRFAPDTAMLERLYGPGGAAADESAHQRGLDIRVSYSHQVEQLLRYFRRPPSDVEVLDFGSGSGSWLRMAAAFGCRTSGSELSADALAGIAAEGHESFASGALPQSRFDFVNTEQVVEHLVDPLPVVRHLAASLRPGGLLRISVPNGSDIHERLAVGDWSAPKGSPRSLNSVAPLEHVNCFTAASLRRLGTVAGLEPFVFPLRTEVHPLGRIRYAASAVLHRVRRPEGTVQYFRRTSATT